MHKKFEINQTKIKGGCQLGRKVVTHNSKSHLPLIRKLFSLDFKSLKSSLSQNFKIVTLSSEAILLSFFKAGAGAIVKLIILLNFRLNLN